MEIPWQRLDPETLDNLVEEYVSREGTDYGHQDYSLADKVRQVKRQLREGSACLVFDAESQSCHILLREEGGPRMSGPPSP